MAMLVRTLHVELQGQILLLLDPTISFVSVLQACVYCFSAYTRNSDKINSDEEILHMDRMEKYIRMRIRKISNE